MYLLDTDVFSITSPTNGLDAAAAGAWRQWVRENESALFFSAVTVMEVRFGIEKLMAGGATRKAAVLRQWLASAQTLHRNRIIPVSTEIAHKAGELLYGAIASGFNPSSEDAFIAATAHVEGYTLLSRNSKDMGALKATLVNPLEGLPPAANMGQPTAEG